MSNPWALAAVTETLVQRLRTIAAEDTTLNPLTVSSLAPDRARLNPNTTARQLNLFLYQVAPNRAWANADLPFRDSDGNQTRQPVLALDMRYLLTAYGLNNDETDAHHALAHGMSLLHDQGVFRRKEVRDALNAAGAPLRDADLDKQVELIKVSPLAVSEEEMFRMWTVFGTSYRLSVCYEATVALIERPRTAKRPPPVREAQLTVVPLRVPVIEDIAPRPATAGATLTLTGLNLQADRVMARFATADVVVPAADVKPTELKVALPSGLRAGPNTVQVLQDVTLPGTSGTRPFFTSDVAAFVLAPRITTTIPAAGLPVSVNAELTLNVQPPVAKEQRVALLLGERSLPRKLAHDAPDTSNSVAFDIPAGFPTGTVLLRVVVDGAESALVFDTTSGTYVGPKAVVS